MSVDIDVASQFHLVHHRPASHVAACPCALGAGCLRPEQLGVLVGGLTLDMLDGYRNPQQESQKRYNNTIQYLTTRLFFGRIIDLSISFVGLQGVIIT